MCVMLYSLKSHNPHWLQNYPQAEVEKLGITSNTRVRTYTHHVQIVIHNCG